MAGICAWRFRRAGAFPGSPTERYVDRFFGLVFWGYFAATYTSYLVEERRFGMLPVSLAFVALAVAWLLLPWNPRVPRARLLAVPAFLVGSTAVVYLAEFGFSVGLYSIAVANAVFLFGSRRALAYAAVLLPLIVASYFLDYPGQGIHEAVEFAAYYVPTFAFVVGICTMAARAVEGQVRARDLLLRLEAANDELRRSSERVRELSIAEERARMARELHDSVGHYLTVVNVQLEAAGLLLDRDPGRARDDVAKAKALASEALAEIRRSVRALRPLALEEQAGAGALRALASGFRDTGMAVSFAVVGRERPLPPETELVLYRTLQEGLTNALRHSGAERVRAELSFGSKAVCLTVIDDGRGSGGGGAPAGVGLAGLAERAAALGGGMGARDLEAGGFALEVELPVARA